MFQLKVLFLALLTAATAKNTTSASATVDWLPVFELRVRDNRAFDYTVEIGSPQQSLELRLDVGNANLWVPGADSFTACPTTRASSTTEDSSATESASAYTTPCAPLGVYDLNSSSSGTYFSGEQDIAVASVDDATGVDYSYLDGIGVSGYLAVDDFDFPIYDAYENGSSVNHSLAFQDVRFLYANDSNVNTGALGLGIPCHDYSVSFIDYFKEANFIQNSSYSLITSTLNSSDPVLVLGGVSSTRISGNFYQYDFIPVVDVTQRFVTVNGGYTDTLPIIPITGIGVTANDGETVIFPNTFTEENDTGTYPKPALLDSRTLYNFIPYSTLIELALELNAYYASDMDVWLVDCDIGSVGTIDIHLGDLVVKMPISSVLYEQKNEDGSDLVFQSGDKACALAFLPDNTFGYSLLGIPFLKNIYLAVNNDYRTLAISNIVRDDEKNSKADVFYPMDSGTIPLAQYNNISSYSEITMTVTTYALKPSQLPKFTEAFVSDGEVYLTGTDDSPSTSAGPSPSGSYSSSARNAASSHRSSTVLPSLLGLLVLFVYLL
ncbi:hypothetical protein KL942_003671 [Ogataea angusta]|uniref:Peptidase A1 domain-containing protein n=1 Tax=Pichia angusta TaxID=870730 RepID=A0ABQ7RWW5_PICAN|nr:hypothetical protein KL942_003671 [Ogataea angusta]KAG7849580.1 hypothetical protein KL940_002610 [Ogataea angusta]